MSEIVVLVDEKDHPIGYEEKMKAHSDGGKLHRAFSIFIYNSRNQMLLQLRSNAKHHFQSLWRNGCCSHPLKGEEIEKAAHRKLKQEFGFDTEMKEVFSFLYKAKDPNSGLTEHEFDHVFIGEYNGVPKRNPEEIDDGKWVNPTELQADLTKKTGHYTPCLKPAYEDMWQRLRVKLCPAK